MVSKFESLSSNGTLRSVVLNMGTFTFTKAQKRWRIACIMICFSLSLARKILPTKRKYRESSKRFDYPSACLLDIIEPAASSCSDHVSPAPIAGNVDDTCFAKIDPKRIALLVKNKNLDELHSFGDVEGLAKILNTNIETGINGSGNDASARISKFGPNTYKKPPPKGLLYYVIEAFRDTTILILLGCAALSLGFGIKERGLQEGWYEGGSIFLAVFLVVAVSAASNFRQEKQFQKLANVSDNIVIDAIRDGRRRKISIFDIVVGDIIFLTIGDQVPADGLFIVGHSLQVDESSMTGESDHVEVDSFRNPFLLSGSKIADGYGRMLVISVGMNTAWGEMMSSITRDSSEQTPLQFRLQKLTTSIGKAGLLVAFLVLAVMLIRYFTGNTEDVNGNREYNGGRTGVNDVFNSVLRIVSVAVTIVVVAIPEGLPLAVTLTLAYSMKRMMKDQAMVRKLSACETMGSATVICTDKTGTLTMNAMKVMKFWLGQQDVGEEYAGLIPSGILELFHQGIALNTTGSVCKPISGSQPEVSGSPTEKAILFWALQKLDMDMEKLKLNYKILHVDTFNSEKKRSGILTRRKEDNTLHVHWKGAAEMVLAMCSNYYQTNGEMKSIDESERMRFESIIQGMAASSLRCIAFSHKHIKNEEIQHDEYQRNHKKLEEDGFTLLGIIGLKDPCRPGVRDAIKASRNAGVEIKMITGDNVFTAKAIARECGILGPDQRISSWEVIEGVQFRNLTHDERIQKVDGILVMARSSPFDKLLMVQCLKQKGHVVAVTGDGTNDAPALKEADIGLSMGIQGTEVAKESSDIVILDDDFASVTKVLKWGRCVYNNIQKFIQFQLTVNVAALVINFIAAVSAGDVPLTTVQLLWVNLIMDTLGALALATEKPTDELMRKPPVGRSEPLITNIMWRNISAQALYQIAVLLVLQFNGKSILNVNERVKNTIIFNSFVFCQVFNEFNSREMEQKNVFKGLHQNHLFLAIVGVTTILQVVMVEFLNKFADTERLSWEQWMICIAIAALTWPIGLLVKFIPVTQKPFLDFFRFLNPR